MSMPGFTADASLYKMDECYHGVLIVSIDGMKILPQMMKNVTFVISGGSSCMCYEDTEAMMSICECD